MKTSKKLIFFGTENFSVPSLKALIDAGYNLAGVVTKPDAPAGRGRSMKSPAVKAIAEQVGIKSLQPADVSAIKNELQKLEAGFGILVAYGKILPQEIINIFPGGIINVHPSLLSKYRGPAPIETAILNGDEETGVSLMSLTAEMDAGPVYAQKVIKIQPDVDRLRLSEDLAQVGASLLMAKLPDIIEGNFKPLPQDETKATYTKLLKKSDGFIDWANESAENIERKVRAYLGFPKTTAKVLDKYDVVVVKARVAAGMDDGDLVIRTKDSYIEILQLVAPSGRTVSGADFLKGYAQA